MINGMGGGMDYSGWRNGEFRLEERRICGIQERDLSRVENSRLDETYPELKITSVVFGSGKELQ